MRDFFLFTLFVLFLSFGDHYAAEDVNKDNSKSDTEDEDLIVLHDSWEVGS